MSYKNGRPLPIQNQADHSPAIIWFFTCLLIGSILFPSVSNAQFSETEVKAAFIGKIVDFINWPSSSQNQEFQSSGEYFTIGVFGHTPLVDSIQKLYHASTIKGKKTRVITVSSDSNFSDIQIVYAGTSDIGELEYLVRKINSKPILLVTDHEGYAIRGAHLNLVSMKNRIAIEMNRLAINKSGLEVNSKLMRMAILIN